MRIIGMSIVLAASSVTLLSICLASCFGISIAYFGLPFATQLTNHGPALLLAEGLYFGALLQLGIFSSLLLGSWIEGMLGLNLKQINWNKSATGPLVVLLYLAIFSSGLSQYLFQPLLSGLLAGLPWQAEQILMSLIRLVAQAFSISASVCLPLMLLVLSCDLLLGAISRIYQDFFTVNTTAALRLQLVMLIVVILLPSIALRMLPEVFKVSRAELDGVPR